MVVRANAGRAFIRAADGARRLMGVVDRAATGRLETDGDAVADRGRFLVERAQDPELRPSAGRPVADGIGIVHVAHQAERLQKRIVEGLGLAHVVAADRDVTEH